MRPFPGDRQAAELAGWAEYGYCASHSRWFWGLRLHLLCTLGGLLVAFALTGAKADERQVLPGIFEADPGLVASRPGQALTGDKNYDGTAFETALAGAGLRLLRVVHDRRLHRAAFHSSLTRSIYRDRTVRAPICMLPLCDPFPCDPFPAPVWPQRQPSCARLDHSASSIRAVTTRRTSPVSASSSLPNYRTIASQ